MNYYQPPLSILSSSAFIKKLSKKINTQKNQQHSGESMFRFINKQKVDQAMFFELPYISNKMSLSIFQHRLIKFNSIFQIQPRSIYYDYNPYFKENIFIIFLFLKYEWFETNFHKEVVISKLNRKWLFSIAHRL